jgi:hypothetical protein
MSRVELEKWRAEFWGKLDCNSLETRTSGAKQVWELLHNACLEDQATAVALIEAAEL